MGVHHGMAPGASLVSPGLCHLGQASPDVGSLAVSRGQATRVETPRAAGCVWLGTPGDRAGQEGTQQVPDSGITPSSHLGDELDPLHPLSLLAPGILVRAQRGQWAP